MNYLLLLFKGFIIGMAKIIPGVSGAVLSISFGVYEPLLNIMSHPLKIKFEDLKFLFTLLLGAALGILVFCTSIKWCLDKFYLPTMLLFIGLIIGGLPELTEEIKNKKTNKTSLIIFAISFTLVLIITNLSDTAKTTSTHYFIMGIIESLTTIIPGISGTAIFMAMGWYESLLDTINSVLTFTAPLTVSINFIGGFITATILISKFLTYIFKEHKIKAYYSILGFMGASLWTMFTDIFINSFTIPELIIGIILFIIGIMSTIKINNFFSKF